ncbi:MAG TPA: FeoA family protein [Chloroflexota bacterium]|nr:FeoA family protein [Chloroflexota bacterium]
MAACPLCGGGLVSSGTCRGGCPLAGTCQLQCCPECGYQTVDESRSMVARLVRRLFGGTALDTASESGMPVEACAPQRGATLADLRPGEEAEVGDYGEMPEARQVRLAALGMAPGDRVRVVQRRPVPVIRVGETEIALGEEILSQVALARRG